MGGNCPGEKCSDSTENGFCLGSMNLNLRKLKQRFTSVCLLLNGILHFLLSFKILSDHP